MAYLTNYNFNYLFKIAAADQIFDKNFVVTPELFYEKIYKNPSIYYLLGKLEKANLIIVEKLLNANPTEFKNLLFAINMKEVKLYRNEPPRYHIYKDCKLLYQDYIQVFYPDDIDEKSELGREYYQWILNKVAEIKPYNHKKIMDRAKVGIIIYEYQHFFAPQHNLKTTTENFVPIQFLKNSGLFSNEEDNFDVLNKKIDEILCFRKAFIRGDEMRENFSKIDFMVKQSDTEIIEIIRKRSNNTLYEKDIPKIRKFWSKHLEIRKKVYDIILDYLRHCGKKWCFFLNYRYTLWLRKPCSWLLFVNFKKGIMKPLSI